MIYFIEIARHSNIRNKVMRVFLSIVYLTSPTSECLSLSPKNAVDAAKDSPSLLCPLRTGLCFVLFVDLHPKY